MILRVSVLHACRDVWRAARRQLGRFWFVVGATGGGGGWFDGGGPCSLQQRTGEGNQLGSPSTSNYVVREPEHSNAIFSTSPPQINNLTTLDTCPVPCLRAIHLPTTSSRIARRPRVVPLPPSSSCHPPRPRFLSPATFTTAARPSRPHRLGASRGTPTNHRTRIFPSKNRSHVGRDRTVRAELPTYVTRR